MPLPKVNQPITEIEVPSTKKHIKVRPMLGKEEKVLLIAKESADENDVLLAVKQVINNCILEQEFDIDKLSIFDLEFLFIKLRALSVNNIIKVSYIDNEDIAQGVKENDATYSFEIDLNKVKIKWPEKINKRIVVNEQINIQMKYPDATLYSNKEFLNTQGRQAVDMLIQNTIDKVFEGTVAYDFANNSPEDTQTFLDSLPISAIEKMREFLVNLPTVYHEINYKNKQDHERKVVLSTLNDFFTLR